MTKKPAHLHESPTLTRLETVSLLTTKMARQTLAETTGYRYRPGEAIGAFVIERPLGRGGMGEVYAALDRRSERRVALKVLHRGAEAPDERERFLREGKLAARVSHPNSVYIFGSEEIDGGLAISMELVPGPTLRELVEARGALPPAAAVEIVLQVLAGLEAAAEHGILHRDVKPGNCFVNDDGTVKVGDYGLSIPSDPSTTRLSAVGSIVGTPAFASPEQLDGGILDTRSDIYSLGATLFYLLTGRPPYTADSLLLLLNAIAKDDPPSPRAFSPQVSKPLSRLVLRCLARGRSKRPAGYGELREALLAFAGLAHKKPRMWRRAVAGFVDVMAVRILRGTVGMSVFFLFEAPVIGLPGSSRFQPEIAYAGLSFLLGLLYFGLTEGVWATSPGKRIMGLVVMSTRGGRPGWLPLLVRASLFLLALDLARRHTLVLFSPGPQPPQAEGGPGLVGLLAMSGMSATLLFLSARRHNGYAGLHDLLTQVRVVEWSMSAVPAQSLERAHTPQAEGKRIGPFRLVEPSVEPLATETTYLAVDEVLDRPVWLRASKPGESPVSEELRRLTRPTRQRWVQGMRSADGGWDAWEALRGIRLSDLAATPQPWSVIRNVLLQLAGELRDSLNSGSLPESLSLDRVWLLPTGRLKVAEVASPHDASEPFSRPTDAVSAQSYLYRTAISLCAAGDESSWRRRVPALSIHRLLERLKRGFLTDLDEVVSSIEGSPAHARPVGRAEVALALAVASWLPLLVFLSWGSTTAYQESRPLWTVLLQPEGAFSFAATFSGRLPAYLALAVVFRGGLGIAFAGLAIVDASGKPASRVRAGWRALLARLPLLLAVLPTLLRLAFRPPGGAEQLRPEFLGPISFLMVGLFIAGVACWLVTPSRGLHDRLAGTSVVRR